MVTPALIGIDWGSTSLRAYLIASDGAVLAEHAAGKGASTLHGHPAFVAALDDVAGAWQKQNATLPLLACGMVGSQHGWLDVPYVRCPAGAADLAAGVRQPDDTPLRIVPGVLCDDGALPPDVMRGEETQIVGALAHHAELADSCVVLPGTHSKWTHVAQGRIVRFATHMTGELYAVLRQHSVLGRLMTPEVQPDTDAFLRGVTAARDAGELGLPHQLFAVRSLGVTEQLPHAALAEYLSGLLIGHELRAGLAWRSSHALTGKPLALVGAPTLCERYRLALGHFGQPANLVLDNTAPAGLLALARAAQLISS